MNNFGFPPPQLGHVPGAGTAPPFNPNPTLPGGGHVWGAPPPPQGFVGGQPVLVQVAPSFNPQAVAPPPAVGMQGLSHFGGGMNLQGFGDDPRWAKQRERKQQERKGSAFPTIDVWKLEKDMPYQVRFINHPTHLPGGFHCFTVHLIQTQPGKDPVRVLCTESYEDVRRDIDGSLIKQPCYFCDVMEALDEDELLDTIFRTDPSMYAAICGVEAKDEITYGFNAWNNRKYCFPALMKARMVKVGEYENPMSDYNALQPCIITVRERDGLGKTSTAVIDQIRMLNQQNQYLTDPTYGSWFTIMKSGNTYQLGNMEQASSLYQTIPTFPQIYEKYPNLRTWGCGQGSFKKSLKQSYDYCKALTAGTWWGQKLVTTYGFDISDFTAY